MKDLANYISISRMIMAMVLLIPETFSIAFWIIYIYCGLSDMLDGYIARKKYIASEIGEKLDSVADIVFLGLALIKILPVLNLSGGIVVWLIFIAIIRVINIIIGFIINKRLMLLHTTANKITGIALLIAPIIILNTNLILVEIFICALATFAAGQEGYCIMKEETYLI